MCLLVGLDILTSGNLVLSASKSVYRASIHMRRLECWVVLIVKDAFFHILHLVIIPLGNPQGSECVNKKSWS